MKQNAILQKSTLAALMLAAMAGSTAAHAAESGKANFSADIEAHSPMKCEVSVSVDDSLVATATYTKGTNGELGKLTLTKTGNSVLTASVKGVGCTLDGYRLVAAEAETGKFKEAVAKTRRGLNWPIDIAYGGYKDAKLANGTVDPRPMAYRIRPNGVTYKTPTWQKDAAEAGEVKWLYGDNPQLPVHHAATGKVAGENDTTWASTAQMSYGFGQGGVEPVRFYTKAVEVGINIAAIVGEHPYDPETLKPDDSKLEDGEEVVFTRTLTLTAP